MNTRDKPSKEVKGGLSAPCDTPNQDLTLSNKQDSLQDNVMDHPIGIDEEATPFAAPLQGVSKCLSTVFATFAYLLHSPSGSHPTTDDEEDSDDSLEDSIVVNPSETDEPAAPTQDQAHLLRVVKCL